MADEAPKPGDWTPNAGPQTRFLASSANEVLYGGAAGGGKSAAIIALPLRWVDNPSFRALVLRRDTKQLVDLLNKAGELYPYACGGIENKTDHVWRFPSGATVWFTHVEHETDVKRFDGHEFQLVEFDELTHFTEKQYRAIRARIRSSKPGLPRYTRATTNPGGDGHEWVFGRFGPWLDPEFKAAGLAPRIDVTTGASLPPARPGEVLWYLPSGNGERWVPPGTPGALSRVFIPARLADNPKLLEHDPTYARQLLDLDPVRRAQLLDGNWLVRPAAGAYFKREWFDTVDAAPAEADRVRYWDRAASLKGDWTVGVRLARTQQRVLYVEDVVRFRGRPADVLNGIKTTAANDGKRIAIGIEQDPGQAGVVEADVYTHELQGFNVHLVRPTGSKLVRAQPVSAQAEARNIRLVRGAWKDALVQELEAFPDGEHDDQVDALSGAFAAILAGLGGDMRKAEAIGQLASSSLSSYAGGGWGRKPSDDDEFDEPMNAGKGY